MDEETKKEWEKSKQIEAERMKAVRALEEDDKEARINSAFLDPENRKVKGYSRDTTRIMRSIEKASEFSMGFVILGVIFNSSLRIAAMIGVNAAFGMLVQIISAIGLVLLGISAILALVSLTYSFRYKKTENYDNKNIIITSSTALLILLAYILFFMI